MLSICLGLLGLATATTDFLEANPTGSPLWWTLVGVVMVLFLLHGLISGLISGLLELELGTLIKLRRDGTEEQRQQCDKVIPLMHRYHFVLVTLICVNTACVISLPVVLVELGVTGWLAFVVVVPLVILFGDTIPTGFCTRHGLVLAYYLHWFVWLLMFLFGVVSWPLSKVLDGMRTTEQQSFFTRHGMKQTNTFHEQLSRSEHKILSCLGQITIQPMTGFPSSHYLVEISTFLEQHGGDAPIANDDSDEENELQQLYGDAPLLEDEMRIIRGALLMRAKVCNASIYTDIKDTYHLTSDVILTAEKKKEIASQGHSRIPVFHHKKKEVFLGILLVKNLLALEDDTTMLLDVELVQAPQVATDIPLYTLLNQFMLGKCHMAIVLDREDNSTIVGVVTLEDVIEELVQAEIYDEKDMQILSRPQIFQDLAVNKIVGAKIIELQPPKGKEEASLRPIGVSSPLSSIASPKQTRAAPSSRRTAGTPFYTYQQY